MEWQKRLESVFEGNTDGFELIQLKTDQSPYYVDDSCFEIVIFASELFQKSPWAFGFQRKSETNKIHFMPRLKGCKPSCKNPKNAASLAFLEMKHLKSSESVDKKGSNQGLRGIAKNKFDNPQVVETPQSLMKKLNEKYKFDFDPCPVQPEHDAMQIEWGKCNFVNPPFRYTHGFIVKATEEAMKGNKSVFLIPDPSRAHYFTPCLLAGVVNHLTFLRSGLKFKGYKAPCPLTMVLLEIGPPEKGTGLSFWDPFDEVKKRKIKSHKMKC